MKKILFSLVCALGMSLMVNAETATTVYYAIPDAQVGTYTLKLNVCLQWNGKDDASNIWQQYVMEKTTETFNSNPIYKATFTDKWDGANTMQFQLYDGEEWKSQEVAFDGSSDGKWTTVDNYNGKMWVYGETGWQAYQTDGGGSSDPKTVTLYYVNTTKWETVKAYVWYAEGETNHPLKEWSGEAMTKTGDQVNGYDIYSYTFDTKYVKVIFNNGDKDQTSDLVWNAATPYYYEGKWYAETKDIPAPAKTVTLYYVNTNKWETVKAYVWYKEGETDHPLNEWSGEAMTKTGDQVNGYDIYSYTFATEYVNVIFNNGDKAQTSDLVWDAATPYYYDGKWYAETKDIPAPAKTVTLYYVNTNKWETVKAYVWYKEGETDHPLNEWSGEAMTKTGDQVNGYDIYSYTFATEYVNVIFNNGDKDQTSDLVWDAATPYYYEGKWYAETKDIPAPAKTVTLYYVNTNKWETVKAYVWYKEGETDHPLNEWSGEAMTKTGDQVNGYDIYSYTFATEYVNVIFNNGDKAQTSDLVWDAATPYYYEGKWYAETKDIPAPATTVTLYYVNTTKWETVKAYVWYKEGETDHPLNEWSGEAMTKTGDQVNGYDIYSYTFDTKYVKVIFNNGDKDQTSDLVWNAATPYYYEGKWYAETKDIPAPATTVTLYYVNTTKWETVKAYVWYKEGETDNVLNDWPGEAMTKTGDQVNGFDVYSYTFAVEYVNIIFNNGVVGEGEQKTADLTWNATAPYFYEGKWYAQLSDIPTGDDTPDFGIMVNDNDYYAGVKNEEYKGEGTEYVVTATLTVGDRFKNYDNVAKAEWLVALDEAGYKFTATDGYYVVTETGIYTLYIKIIGEGRDNMYVAFEAGATALDEMQINAEGSKVIVNGVLYILRDGKRYNAQGVEVK